MSTIDMYSPTGRRPRRPPRVMMHGVDHGCDDAGEDMAIFQCRKCGYESDWLPCGSATAGRRGIPCLLCNPLIYTDRELLELAAKAAGAEITGMRGSEPLYGMPTETADGATEYEQWSPLTDDADAFRLAVKLEISVNPCMEETSAHHPACTGWVYEQNPSDPCAATRRAIVRAAAELGRLSP